MSLASGTRLGPYEITAPIGAGGMGEVYRATDTRLDRVVAIKILPARLSSSPGLKERFEREARAISSLNHARICTLHDIGAQDGIHFLVMEFLEGETLAQRVRRGPVPLKEALQIGIEICEALDVAHRAGIVHRDLKPGNVMLTKSGAKLMDFGLAKAAASASSTGATTDAPLLSAAETITGSSPLSALTGAGQVVGTIQYMSPEQIEGKDADARSDIFALGCVLYETITGKRPFEAKSQLSVASAILEKEPPPMRETRTLTPPVVEHVVKTCLAKSPDMRYQSVRDVALELRWILDEGLIAAAPGESQLAAPQARWKRILPWALAGALLLGVIALAAVYHSAINAPVPAFRQLTFERGFVYNARFAPDERTVYYGAAWNGSPVQIYAADPDIPEARPLNLKNTSLFAVSSADLAVSLGCEYRFIGTCFGTLAQVPSTGGTPRPLQDHVMAADWTRDASKMVIVRFVSGKYRLEYPRGTLLYESDRPLNYARVSPDGSLIAVCEEITIVGDGGEVIIFDRSGKKVVSSATLESVEGIAWAPSGQELWIATAVNVGWANTIRAMDLKGKMRVVLTLPGELRLHDIAPDGRVLFSKENWRSEVQFRGTGDKNDRNLSWLDYANLKGISDDGSKVSFEDWGSAAGAASLAYLRETDGSPPQKLGEWSEPVISPDGKNILALEAHETMQGGNLTITPAGAGEPKKLSGISVVAYAALGWMPDGKSIYFYANDGHGWKVYVQSTDGPPRAVTPLISVRAGYWEGRTVSPDGKYIFARDPEGTAKLYPLDGGSPKEIAGWKPDDVWACWMKEPGIAYVYQDNATSAQVYRLDVNTGSRQPVSTLTPNDPAGVTAIISVLFTPDGKSYAYSYIRELSELFEARNIH
jgi:eukaryotic-like serine/threonine-protein kinase